MGLIVAAIQMQSGDDKARNLASATAMIDAAAGRGAQVVALPEFFIFWGPARRQREEAEELSGPTLHALAHKASGHRIYLLAGSIPERAGERIFNTSVLLGPDGTMIGVYRKIHLFDVDIKGQLRMRESDAVLAGQEVVSVETAYCRVGMSICYDLRFPELYRTLAAAGARLIFVPSSFMAATGKDHWEPLLRARAIENQAFVVAPDEVGPIPGSGLLRHGHSMIVDPWGAVLAQAGETDSLVMADLNLDYLEKVRRELPALDHRRLHC